ncbi:MAG: sigma-70 family RNA polymerase sigma factor [Planctomycetaceae bacterium]|nr:sigma-70 family RNA polymerase sigma factor [Planctomycetaceae bacterium]
MQSNSASNGPSSNDPFHQVESGERLAAAEIETLQREGAKALAVLFDRYRGRLEKIVEFRMDERIKRRIDPADVLQEAYIELARRLPEFLNQPSVSVFVWMRQKTLQTLIDLHREHFRNKRDPNKELQQAPNWNSHETGLSINAFLSASMTSPSQHLIRGEEVLRLQAAIQNLNELDREVIALRHFEQLTNLQVAEVLNLSPTAASNRYIRAISRLSENLTDSSGTLGKK